MNCLKYVVLIFVMGALTLPLQAAQMQTHEDKLHEAVKNCELATVQALLQNPGININALSRFVDRTPIMVAVLEGCSEIVKELIRVKANLNIKDRAGKTALIYAVEKGDEDVLGMLIAAGADVTIPSKSGTTALMIAARDDYKDIIITLLNAGADPHAITDQGKSFESILRANNPELLGDRDVRLALKTYEFKLKNAKMRTEEEEVREPLKIFVNDKPWPLKP